jgi:hypothetical protein
MYDSASSFTYRILGGALVMAALGQQAVPAPPTPAPVLPTQTPSTRADILRGECGRYRANNDLL